MLVILLEILLPIDISFYILISKTEGDAGQEGPKMIMQYVCSLYARFLKVKFLWFFLSS